MISATSSVIAPSSSIKDLTSSVKSTPSTFSSTTSIGSSISLQSESVSPSLSIAASSFMSTPIQPMPTESQAPITTESTQIDEQIDQPMTTAQSNDQSTNGIESINQSTESATTFEPVINIVVDEDNHRSRRNTDTDKDTSNLLQFPVKFLPNIATDLKEAFETGKTLNRVTVKQRDNLTADRIERVIAFTWFDMYSDAETNSLGRRNRHSFQTLLIKVGEQWFAQNYYAVLSSNGNFNVNKNEEGQTCGHASVGISRFLPDTPSDEVAFSRGVYYLVNIPKIFEIFTNEYNWRDLGSWVYDLNPDVGSNKNQPTPITFNCVEDSQDDAKCIILFASSEARSNKKRRRRETNFVEKLLVKFSETSHNGHHTTKNYREKRVFTTFPPTVPITTSKYSHKTRQRSTTFTKAPMLQPRHTFSSISSIGTTTANPNKADELITISDGLFTIPTMPSSVEPNNKPLNISEAAQIIANKYCRYRDPGLYKLPLICDVFISCSLGGKATPMVCPKGTGFNPRINVCDHASYYECNTDNILVNALIPKSQIQLNHRNFCEYQGYGIYPDPSSCTSYYACTNARSIRMSCPAGLQYKPDETKKNGRCEFAYKVNCKEGKRTDEIA
ncbi:uncharacterized protein [Clytia hemisphaerica]|uniref:uncharacterized protein n=1 Tax=Clytia hemisphaerica TaxID=252671 RepID=UPI0034D72AAA